MSDTEFYDSNLFKLPSGIGPIVVVGAPVGTRADEYNIATLGADVRRVIGRQTFDVDGHINETRFDHNSQLNNTSGDGKFLWDWEVGPYLSGQASAAYYRTLAGFNETRYTGKDLVNTVSYFADGRYQIGPRWALLAEGQFDNTTHGAEAVFYNNFRDQTLSAGVEYALTPDDTFSLVYHHFEGHYPRPLLYNGVTLDRDYHEDFPQLYVKYSFSDKTLFDANVGHIKRSYNDVRIGEYTGIIWRAGVDYLFSDKLDFTLRVWHELHAYSASESDYFLSKGITFGPRWAITDKVKVTLAAATENDTYLPGSTSSQIFVYRRDKQNFEQLSLAYQPRDKWTLSLFVRHFERQSNQELIAFDDQFANVSVSYNFF